MTGNVKIIGGGENTKFCFKEVNQFTRSVIHLNETHIESAEHLNLVIKHYNLIEYSDNYQDTVDSLYQFKRDEQELTAAGGLTEVTDDNSSSFKYKSSLLSGLTSEAGGEDVNA